MSRLIWLTQRESFCEERFPGSILASDRYATTGYYYELNGGNFCHRQFNMTLQAAENRVYSPEDDSLNETTSLLSRGVKKTCSANECQLRPGR